MKKLIPPTPFSVNMLQDVHSRLIDLPIQFRQKVCEECSWSTPTFYRKIRAMDKVMDNDKKVVPALSNAEKEKIIAVLDELFQELWNYYERYRRKRNRDPNG